MRIVPYQLQKNAFCRKKAEKGAPTGAPFCLIYQIFRCFVRTPSALLHQACIGNGAVVVDVLIAQDVEAQLHCAGRSPGGEGDGAGTGSGEGLHRAGISPVKIGDLQVHHRACSLNISGEGVGGIGLQRQGLAGDVRIPAGGQNGGAVFNPCAAVERPALCGRKAGI